MRSVTVPTGSQDPGEGRESIFRRFGGSGSHFRRGIVLLLLAACLIVVIDWLAQIVALSWSADDANWWGSAQASPWSNVASAGHGMRLTSRDLMMTVSGDNLTVRYTIKAPANSALATQDSADDSPDAGNDLVDNVLGPVQVAQFRYGFTGPQHWGSPLTFHIPQLSITGRTATVIVSSDPVRLYLRRQYITINEPSNVTVDGPDQIHIKASAVQVAHTSGAVTTSVTNTEAALRSTRATITATVSEGSSGQGWLDGLRSIGGIAIPVGDALLSRLSALFVYVVLLLSFGPACRKFPCSRIPTYGRNAVLLVVTGLAAVAFLGFALDLSTTLFRQDYLTAGPLGLLVGGAGLVWPAACLCAGTGKRPKSSTKRTKSSRLRRELASFVPLGIVVVVYVLALNVLEAFTNAWIWAGSFAAAVLVWALVKQLHVFRGAIAWLVSAGMLAAVLGATITWPVLFRSSSL